MQSDADFASLKFANVRGTLTALRLAEASQAPLVHIGSIGMLSGKREEDFVAVPPPSAFMSGYAKSKWLAERVLYLAKPKVSTIVLRW